MKATGRSHSLAVLTTPFRAKCDPGMLSVIPTSRNGDVGRLPEEDLRDR